MPSECNAINDIKSDDPLTKRHDDACAGFDRPAVNERLKIRRKEKWMH